VRHGGGSRRAVTTASPVPTTHMGTARIEPPPCRKLPGGCNGAAARKAAQRQEPTGNSSWRNWRNWLFGSSWLDRKAAPLVGTASNVGGAVNGQNSYFHQLNTRRRGVEPEVRSSLSAPQRQTGERSTFRGRTNNGGQLQQHWHWQSGTSALALALKGEVPKCLPCALPGSTRLHSATRTSCETAGTGRIPNLIHQMEFLPPKSHTVLLGLTAHTKRLHADWYCPPLTAALDTVSNALPLLLLPRLLPC
jgi:hypothetical protein